MNLHIRNRTIRPSSRQADSAYRVKVDNLQPNDLVVVFIDHESEDFRATYQCRGHVFNGHDSLSFKWQGNSIVWQAGRIPELVVNGNKTVEL